MLTSPLILDPATGAQCGALRSLAALVETGRGLAEILIRDGLLRDIVKAAAHDHTHVILRAHAVLRAIVREGPAEAQALMDGEVMKILRAQIDDLRGEVAETAMQTLNALVASDRDIASAVMGGGMLEHLLGVLERGTQSPAYERSIAATLSDACDHGEDYVRATIDESDAVTLLWTAAARNAEEVRSRRHFFCIIL